MYPSPNQLFMKIQENEKKTASANGTPVLEAPTLEQIRANVKMQMEAAHYALGLLLRTPGAIDAAATEMYDHVMRTSGGSAVDHVNAGK